MNAPKRIVAAPYIDEEVEVSLAEVARLESGDIACQYCHAEPCKPHCRGLDVHPECPHCHNVSGHRSATCPGRYE